MAAMRRGLQRCGALCRVADVSYRQGTRIGRSTGRNMPIVGLQTRYMSSVEIERRVRKLMELERLGDTRVLQEALQRKRELQLPKAPYDVDQMMEAHAAAYRQDNPDGEEVPEHPLLVGYARGSVPLLERPEQEVRTKDAYYNFRFAGGSRGPVAGASLLLRVLHAARDSKRASDLHLAASALHVAQVRRGRNSQTVTNAVAELASLGLKGPWVAALADVENARLFLRGHAWLDIARARAEAEDTEGLAAVMDGMWSAGAKCSSCLPASDECAAAASLEVRAGRPFHAFRWLVRERRLREPRLRVTFNEAGEKELVQVDPEAPPAAVQEPGSLAEVLCAAAGIDSESGEAGDAPAVGFPSQEDDLGLHAAVKCFLRSMIAPGVAARDVGVGREQALEAFAAIKARREAKEKAAQAGGEEEAEEQEGEDGDLLGPMEFLQARVPGGGELAPDSADARVRAAWMGARSGLRVQIDRLQGGPSASSFDDEVAAARGGDEAAVGRHRQLVGAVRGLLGCWEAVFGEELDVVGASNGVMFEAAEEEETAEEEGGKEEGAEETEEGRQDEAQAEEKSG